MCFLRVPTTPWDIIIIFCANFFSLIPDVINVCLCFKKALLVYTARSVNGNRLLFSILPEQYQLNKNNVLTLVRTFDSVLSLSFWWFFILSFNRELQRTQTESNVNSLFGQFKTLPYKIGHNWCNIAYVLFLHQYNIHLTNSLSVNIPNTTLSFNCLLPMFDMSNSSRHTKNTNYMF